MTYVSRPAPWLAAGLLLFAPPGASRGDKPAAAKLSERRAAVDEQITKELPTLDAFYKERHRQPELSLQEEKTAERLAKEMEALGFTVARNVGGFGVVCVLKNGPGPTVLVRTDMDALPVVEQTGLPYASKARARDRTGADVGVMHACGHDMHMTCWLGTAKALAALKDRWSGTLVFIGQPAEEIGTGARLMLEAGLFERFPRPDYALALHCDGRLPVGQVSYTEGLALANVDSVDILVRGKGGHGASPHTTVDPVVLAARIVLDLQTIVSREVNPIEPAVVTVGSIHGGSKHNIIPGEVKLQITVRTTKDEVRKHVLEAIERIARAAAAGARAPEPVVKVDPGEFTPATVNDRELTRRTVSLFRDVIGAENVVERPPTMGGEDFGRFGRAGVPIFMYFLGTIDADRYAASQREGAAPLPSLHSDIYHPVPEPSIKTGVLTMTMAVLNLVGNDKR
jgi:hippurate hydrolase